MSYTSPFFQYQNYPNAASPNQADLGVSKNYPGLALVGTETEGEWDEFRNIQGVLWITCNASYIENTTTGVWSWQQVNTGLPSYARTYANNSTATTTYSAAAGQPSSGIVWVATSSGNLSYKVFTPQAYGALANGVQDDSPYIADAFAAAAAAGTPGLDAGGAGTVFFSPGTYYWNTAGAVAINGGVSVLTFGGAVIVGGPSATNCFTTQPGEITDAYNYGMLQFPSIVGFSGVAIGFPPGATYQHVKIESIRTCGTAFQFKLGNGAIFDLIIDFTVIDTCGVAFDTVSTYNANDTLAGVKIRGNIIIGGASNEIAYRFTGLNATTNASFTIPALNSTVVVSLSSAWPGQNNDQVFIFDGTHNFIGTITAGAQTTSITVKPTAWLGSTTGFATQTMANTTKVVAYYPYVNSNVFEVDIVNGNNPGTVGVSVIGGAFYGNYFRTMGNWGAWEGGNVVCTNGGQFWNAIFDIADYYGGYGQWVGLRNQVPGFHTGNKIRTPLLNGFAILNATIPAQTSSGATGQGLFNGGVVPIAVNNLPLSCALSGLAAGSSADFYAYSPYALGSLTAGARFTITQENPTGGIVCTMCEDETLEAGLVGGQYASQIHIRLTNLSGASYTGTIYGILEVGTL